MIRCITSIATQDYHSGIAETECWKLGSKEAKEDWCRLITSQQKQEKLEEMKWDHAVTWAWEMNISIQPHISKRPNTKQT